MKRNSVAALAAGVAVVLAGFFLVRIRGGAAATGAHREQDWEPFARTIEVEVLNGGGAAGAARDAALRLRRARFDVVSWGNAPVALADTATRNVRILVRRGDTAGVGRVAAVLGRSDVVDAPDPARLVDLTVIIPRPAPEP
ncbi:MAG TPA: LytR C-terminal domain-containing protein [Gemmatimonadales bacterium]|nr:LytR C-terminal domain-containing protein [Gemmatimonadales bacterium]